VPESSQTDPNYYYRIRDWDAKFENHNSRLVKDLSWVRVPIPHGTDAFDELLQYPCSSAALSFWITAIWLAARCRTRGVLIRDSGAAHTAESIGAKCGLAADKCHDAASVLTAIGWLERLPYTAHAFTDSSKLAGDLQQRGALVPDRGALVPSPARARRQEKRREEEKPQPPYPPSPNGKGVGSVDPNSKPAKQDRLLEEARRRDEEEKKNAARNK
jgi:hypothetical protein